MKKKGGGEWMKKLFDFVMRVATFIRIVKESQHIDYTRWHSGQV